MFVCLLIVASSYFLAGWLVCLDERVAMQMRAREREISCRDLLHPFLPLAATVVVVVAAVSLVMMQVAAAAAAAVSHYCILIPFIEQQQ